jgi:chromate reductase
MNIAIISGSARTDNNTLRVAKALEKRFTGLGHQPAIVDFQQYDIPLINQAEIDPMTLSPFQQHLADVMKRAHTIIIITPEYNWSTTPEILNFLHRFGDRMFIDLFTEKVFATVGVSTGKGGKIPALHLHAVLSKIIGFFNVLSCVSPKIFESHFTKDVLDDTGTSLGNNAYENGMDDFIQYTLRVTERWNQKSG